MYMYAAKDAETDTVWTSKDGVQASHRPDVQDLLQILPFHSLLVTAVYLCSPVTGQWPHRSATAPCIHVEYVSLRAFPKALTH